MCKFEVTAYNSEIDENDLLQYDCETHEQPLSVELGCQEKKCLYVARTKDNERRLIGWLKGALVTDKTTWDCDISVHERYRREGVASMLACQFNADHRPEFLRLDISNTTGAIEKILEHNFSKQSDGTWRRK